MKRANHRKQEHRPFYGVGLGLLFRKRRFFIEEKSLSRVGVLTQAPA